MSLEYCWLAWKPTFDAAPGLAIGDPVSVEFFELSGRKLVRFVKASHA